MPVRRKSAQCCSVKRKRSPSASAVNNATPSASALAAPMRSASSGAKPAPARRDRAVAGGANGAGAHVARRAVTVDEQPLLVVEAAGIARAARRPQPRRDAPAHRRAARRPAASYHVSRTRGGTPGGRGSATSNANVICPGAALGNPATVPVSSKSVPSAASGKRSANRSPAYAAGPRHRHRRNEQRPQRARTAAPAAPRASSGTHHSALGNAGSWCARDGAEQPRGADPDDRARAETHARRRARAG